MTSIGIGATPVIVYLLAPAPKLEVALRQYIQNRLSPFRPLSVSIVRIDLKNRVGFGKADELTCELESSVTTPDSPDPTTVKTFSVNKKNMSPFASTAAKVNLQQCLDQHAVEIAGRFATQNSAARSPKGDEAKFE